jgi:uncharacterized protein YlaN (UPF0358 family)
MAQGKVGRSSKEKAGKLVSKSAGAILRMLTIQMSPALFQQWH